MRELAQELQRDAGAVGAAPQVDAVGAELHAHGLEIADRDPGGELPGVGLQFTQATAQLVELLRWIERRSQRGIVVRAVERTRSAGSALVDIDQIAARVEFGKERQCQPDDAGGGLAGSARQHEHRIRLLVACDRGHDGEADLDPASGRLVGIFRHRDRPAQDLALDAGQPARLQTIGARAAAGPAGGQQRGGRQRSDQDE